MPAKSEPLVGHIQADTLYTLADLMKRTGLGLSALRTARRTGLVVRYAGGRGFVLGKDFIDWLEIHGKPTKR